MVLHPASRGFHHGLVHVFGPAVLLRRFAQHRSVAQQDFAVPGVLLFPTLTDRCFEALDLLLAETKTGIENPR